MYFAHNIQILTPICTDNNNFIGDANGCIWRMSGGAKRERDEKEKVSIAIREGENETAEDEHKKTFGT
jgi:hypothetical protein